MEIDVNIKVDEERIMEQQPTQSEVASGWVEIENCIKFPVKVRRYTDKESGKEKMFVTYPQRKNGSGYEGIVYPHDKEVRKEIEDVVLKEVQKEAVKNFLLPKVENVRVSLVQQRTEKAVSLRGLATLKIAGITINGITIKEGKNGLFVQMPQYKSGGEYKDTVYGTNKGIYELIKTEVLKAYEEMLVKEQKQQVEKGQREEQEQQSKSEAVPESAHTKSESTIDRFKNAFEAKDTQEMLDIFAEAQKEVGDARFTENSNAVRLQGAVIAEGDRMVDVAFYNSWNPLQVVPPDEYLKQSIEARIWENGNCIGMPVLIEKQSKSLKNAEKNYNEMLSLWQELTKQEKIEIPREQQKPEARQKAVPVPGFR